jgi:dethiobiotin synthetase
MIVEGVGGLLVPLTRRHTVADLAALIRLPVVLVARARLGTINHTLLTVEALAKRRLRLLGVLLNHTEPPAGRRPSLAEQTAPRIVSRYAPVLGCLPFLGSPVCAGARPIRLDTWLESHLSSECRSLLG